MDFDFTSYYNVGHWWFFALIFLGIACLFGAVWCIASLVGEGLKDGWMFLLPLLLCVATIGGSIYLIRDQSIDDSNQLEAVFAEHSLELVGGVDFRYPFMVRNTDGAIMQCNVLTYGGRGSAEYRAVCKD